MRLHRIEQAPNKHILNNMATFILDRKINGEYYWTLRSDKNYKIIAMSSEGYNSSTAAKESIEWVRANAKGAGFKDNT